MYEGIPWTAGGGCTGASAGEEGGEGAGGAGGLGGGDGAGSPAFGSWLQAVVGAGAYAVPPVVVAGVEGGEEKEGGGLLARLALDFLSC